MKCQNYLKTERFVPYGTIKKRSGTSLLLMLWLYLQIVLTPKYIKRMKSRDEGLKANWGTICTLVPLVSEDGGKKEE